MSIDSNGFIVSKKPALIQCEAKIPLQGTTMQVVCPAHATHIYGPECEATTGKLMYLCAGHAQYIQEWIPAHSNDPVECPTHGRIGPVKSYLILKEM